MIFVRRGEDRREYCRISKGFNEAWRKSGRKACRVSIEDSYEHCWRQQKRFGIVIILRAVLLLLTIAHVQQLVGFFLAHFAQHPHDHGIALGALEHR